MLSYAPIWLLNQVDIYSLGVLLFELYHPFGTGSERFVVLTSLKDTTDPPPEWASRFPKEASLVKSMLSRDPSSRPSAHELLLMLQE